MAQRLSLNLTVPATGTAQGDGLERLRQNAGDRNIGLVRRINSALPPIAIDYAADVVPLTPGGAATERHIVRAYTEKAESYRFRDNFDGSYIEDYEILIQHVKLDESADGSACVGKVKCQQCTDWYRVGRIIKDRKDKTIW